MIESNNIAAYEPYYQEVGQISSQITDEEFKAWHLLFFQKIEGYMITACTDIYPGVTKIIGYNPEKKCQAILLISKSSLEFDCC